MVDKQTVLLVGGPLNGTRQEVQVDCRRIPFTDGQHVAIYLRCHAQLFDHTRCIDTDVFATLDLHESKEALDAALQRLVTDRAVHWVDKLRELQPDIQWLVYFNRPMAVLYARAHCTRPGLKPVFAEAPLPTRLQVDETNDIERMASTLADQLVGQGNSLLNDS